tara:strand:+ start:746 stop:1624 length:879 start_codon:yes stop_codon:yes gene_type:complete
MAPILNSRAKLPADLKQFCAMFKLDFKSLLSVNPKTEKSAIETRILHLSPADSSGVDVCPMAKNCKKICLHFAGNPAYMSTKQAARIRRTLAFSADKQRFGLLLILSILHACNKQSDEILAVRLNGTSDILWENVDLTITPDFAIFCRVKFGALLPIGKRNIFEIFNFIRNHTGQDVTFYDYTKVKRNWAECARIGYHLTFSFDGHDNIQNDKIARDALSHGVNVAAAFNIKRGQSLPDSWMWQSTIREVLDGDLSDFRPSDKKGGHIIGLRFKLPHGMKWTESERDSFCMA